MNPLRYYFPPTDNLNLALDADVCIYGGNSGGVMAALAAKKRGLSVALLEPGRHLGGLTAGGLTYTDIGNKHAIGGLSREFYRRVGRRYGMSEFWTFEPHVAEEVFRDWLAEEGIECHFESFLDRVEMDGSRIRRITTEHGIVVTARMFIDASYEGDLMAKAGVSFTVGREDNATYGESWNGAQALEHHQFELRVDPYAIEGDPASGLLPGIDAEPYVPGAGDHRVQAYNFRLCLTDDPANRVPFTEPPGYRRENYELLARYFRAGFAHTFRKFDRLIHGKVDMNNNGAVSTDFIGMNHDFPGASYGERERIFQEHVAWVRGLLWFRVSDPGRLPETCARMGLVPRRVHLDRRLFPRDLRPRNAPAGGRCGHDGGPLHGHRLRRGIDRARRLPYGFAQLPPHRGRWSKATFRSAPARPTRSPIARSSRAAASARICSSPFVSPPHTSPSARSAWSRFS